VNRFAHTCKDSSKTDVTEIRCEGSKRIHLAHERAQMNMVMNLRVSQNVIS
jgi:hypothetical protein